MSIKARDNMLSEILFKTILCSHTSESVFRFCLRLLRLSVTSRRSDDVTKVRVSWGNTKPKEEDLTKNILGNLRVNLP